MFVLPPLPYSYDALAPVISERTLRIHHGKHHARYIEVTNALLAESGQELATLEDVVQSAVRTGDAKLINNAGQALNHAFFWPSMSPTASRPSTRLLDSIGRGFGGIEGLRRAFVEEGAAHFGSGWVWLTAKDREVSLVSTHDGETMLKPGSTPLLVCDLWEHAYYLDHQNDRAGFLSAWWDNLVDWDFVNGQFESANSGGPGWRFGQAPARQPSRTPEVEGSR
jgi:Fe-Mn family superoxide dismutase